MKLADAPPPGWYPDPEGPSRLRWWVGDDWSDIYRARPTTTELQARTLAMRGTIHTTEAGAGPPVEKVAQTLAQAPEYREALRRDAEDIIAEVRKVARNEVDRAADLFSQRARAATRELQPLISDYTSKLFRWLRIALIVAIVLLVSWFVFQMIAQQSFLDWIGDRIDSLNDEDSRDPRTWAPSLHPLGAAGVLA